MYMYTITPTSMMIFHTFDDEYRTDPCKRPCKYFIRVPACAKSNDRVFSEKEIDKKKIPV